MVPRSAPISTHTSQSQPDLPVRKSAPLLTADSQVPNGVPSSLREASCTSMANNSPKPVAIR